MESGECVGHNWPTYNTNAPKANSSFKIMNREMVRVKFWKQRGMAEPDYPILKAYGPTIFAYGMHFTPG